MLLIVAANGVVAMSASVICVLWRSNASLVIMDVVLVLRFVAPFKYKQAVSSSTGAVMDAIGR